MGLTSSAHAWLHHTCALTPLAVLPAPLYSANTTSPCPTGWPYKQRARVIFAGGADGYGRPPRARCPPQAQKPGYVGGADRLGWRPAQTAVLCWGGAYQQRTGMAPSSADGFGCPPSPQVDRGEVRPHLCIQKYMSLKSPRAGARVRTRRAGTNNAMGGVGG